MPKLSEFIFGRKDKAKQFQQFTPEQMQGLQQLWQALQGGQGPFQDVFGEFNPEQSANIFQRGVAEPAMRNFQQRIQPNIMQAFADQGASSGLGNSLATAGRDLQSNLASQLEMFMNQDRLQNLQRRMGGIQMGMGAQPYQTYVQQGSAGMLPNLIGSFAEGAGQAGGMQFLNMFNQGNQNPMNRFNPMTNSVMNSAGYGGY